MECIDGWLCFGWVGLVWLCGGFVLPFFGYLGLVINVVFGGFVGL